MVDENKYIGTGDTRVNQYISSRIGYYVESILKIINPIGIVLYGSLGRTEGTVVNIGNSYKLLSDFEIGVISRNIFDVLRLRRLNDSWDIGTDDVTISFFLPRRFSKMTVSNWALTSGQLTLEQYNLIAGSKILYGQVPNINQAWCSPGLIMKWDALRLVFNRTAGLLQAFVKDEFDALEIQYCFNKMLIACGDALLILSNNYESSYKKRKIILEQSYSKADGIFTSLNIKWDLILSAYEWKMNPSHGSQNHLSADELLNGSILPTLRICCQTIFGWNFDRTEEFRNLYLASPELKHCSRTFSGNTMFQNMLIAIKRGMKSNDWNFNQRMWREAHEIYAGLICLFESLYQDGSFRESMMLGSKLPECKKREVDALLLNWKHTCSFI